MKKLIMAATLAVSTFLALPLHAGTGSYIIPVTGKTSKGTTVTGTFTVKQFQSVSDKLNAIGTLTLNNVGTATVAWPVTASNPKSSSSEQTDPAAAGASCPVLNLVLGPLHVNLLGLVIDLNQVNLNITAIPGAGNLLGNLLCDIANLLNGSGALSDLINELNQLLSSL